jgi:hypothetical protein
MTDKFFPQQPHDKIERIIENIYFLQGSIVLKPLIRLPRNMVIIKNGEELTVINSVRLSGPEEEDLAKLGKVKHVMRIGLHSIDDAYYVNKFKAKYWRVKGIQDGGELNPDEEISEETQLPFPNGNVFLFKKTNKGEAAILISSEGGLLITCDSVQHWVPSKFLSICGNVVTKFMGFQNPAQIGPPWLKKMTPSGGSLKDDFDRLSKLPFKFLVGAHGGVLRDNGSELLKKTIDRVFK